ncbi:MAG TPA: ABC transporter, partial [Planctomycetota bacterium]|nr:ABC transporter [Planctomycetota bacterium]
EELLLTFPVRIRDAVVGKFLAAWGLLAVALVLTLPIAATTAWLAAGTMDAGPAVGGYLAALLMGGAYLAIGLFVSSLTQHQIIAAVVTLAILGVLWLAGSPLALASMPGWLRPIASAAALETHFRAIGRGLLDLGDVLYYATVIGLFLGLNGIVLDARRWR